MSRNLNITVEELLEKLKAQGCFDAKRKQFLSEITNKSTFQNLHTKVENLTTKFLDNVRWPPTVEKHALRERLRLHLQSTDEINNCINRLVEQEVNCKIQSELIPLIESKACEYLDVDYDRWKVNISSRSYERERLETHTHAMTEESNIEPLLTNVLPNSQTSHQPRSLYSRQHQTQPILSQNQSNVVNSSSIQSNYQTNIMNQPSHIISPAFLTTTVIPPPIGLLPPPHSIPPTGLFQTLPPPPPPMYLHLEHFTPPPPPPPENSLLPPPPPPENGPNTPTEEYIPEFPEVKQVSREKHKPGLLRTPDKEREMSADKKDSNPKKVVWRGIEMTLFNVSDGSASDSDRNDIPRHSVNTSLDYHKSSYSYNSNKKNSNERSRKEFSKNSETLISANNKTPSNNKASLKEQSIKKEDFKEHMCSKSDYKEQRKKEQLTNKWNYPERSVNKGYRQVHSTSNDIQYGHSINRKHHEKQIKSSVDENSRTITKGFCKEPHVIEIRNKEESTSKVKTKEQSIINNKNQSIIKKESSVHLKSENNTFDEQMSQEKMKEISNVIKYTKEKPRKQKQNIHHRTNKIRTHQNEYTDVSSDALSENELKDMKPVRLPQAVLHTVSGVRSSSSEASCSSSSKGQALELIRKINREKIKKHQKQKISISNLHTSSSSSSSDSDSESSSPDSWRLVKGKNLVKLLESSVSRTVTEDKNLDTIKQADPETIDSVQLRKNQIKARLQEIDAKTSQLQKEQQMVMKQRDRRERLRLSSSSSGGVSDSSVVGSNSGSSSSSTCSSRSSSSDVSQSANIKCGHKQTSKSRFINNKRVISENNQKEVEDEMQKVAADSETEEGELSSGSHSESMEKKKENKQLRNFVDNNKDENVQLEPIHSSHERSSGSEVSVSSIQKGGGTFTNQPTE